MAPCPSKFVVVAAAVLAQLHRGAEGAMMLRGAEADAASQPAAVSTPVSADWNPDAEADADWKQMLADGSLDGAEATETAAQEDDVRADEDTDINDPDDAPAPDQIEEDVVGDDSESLMMQTKAKSDKDVKDDSDVEENPEKEMQAEAAKMKAEGTFDDDADSAQNAKESGAEVDCDSDDVVCNKDKSAEDDETDDAVAVEGESLAQVGSHVEEQDDDADGEGAVDDDDAVDGDLDDAEEEDDAGLEDDDEDDDDAADDEDADDDLF